MTQNLQNFWVYLSSTPLLGLTLTLLAYLIASSFYKAMKYAAWAIPLAWATLMIIVLLKLTHTEYKTYFEGAKFIHFLLGPSVVAMAVLLWQKLPQLKKQAIPLIAASIIGGTVAAGSVVLFAWLLGFPPKVILSMVPKSITTPVAMGVAEKIGGLVSLVAVFTVLTGIMGALIGDFVFKIGRIHSQAARGYALGTASHAIGTAAALQMSHTAGAYGALAVGVQAVVGALLIPIIFHLFF